MTESETTTFIDDAGTVFVRVASYDRQELFREGRLVHARTYNDDDGDWTVEFSDKDSLPVWHPPKPYDPNEPPTFLARSVVMSREELWRRFGKG